MDEDDSAPVGDGQAPFEALAGRVEAHDGSSEGTDDSSELDPFDREPVDVIDGDAFWDRLERPGAIEPPADRDIREVDKHRFCHGCDHFRRPPEVGCDHDGTTILAVSSTDTFRVEGCPVVHERRALGQIEE